MSVVATDPSLNLQRFTGRYYTRNDEGYEAARVGRIWHTRYPARYPAAILMAESEADCVEAVLLAKERGWKIAVRAGGHSFPVWSVQDDGLMVDLGGMKHTTYDAATGIATATPAVKGGDELNAYLRQFDRFFPGGGCPSVGVGGFLLQGGIGWNFRGWGWAAERVVGIDVVTADGKLVHASETENSDLFWAARGMGPGFFGLITRFHLRTRPVSKALSQSLRIYRMEHFPEVLRWLWANQTKFDASVSLYAMSMKPTEPLPDHDGSPVFVVWALTYSDNVEEATAALTPMDEIPLLNKVLQRVDMQPTTMEEQYAFVAAFHPEAKRYRVDSAWVAGDHDEIIKAAHMLVKERPTGDPGHTFFCFKLPRPDAPDMAMSLETDLMVGAYVIYDDPAKDEEYRNWFLEAMNRLNPYSIGQYWGDSDQLNREVKCLTDEAWARVQEIRAVRDPDRRLFPHLAGEGGFRNRNAWEELGQPALGQSEGAL